MQDFTVCHSSCSHRALVQVGEILSHQAVKGKVNFQEQGLVNFQEGEDDFRKPSKNLLFCMNYVLIFDLQNFFVYKEFLLK